MVHVCVTFVTYATHICMHACMCGMCVCVCVCVCLCVSLYLIYTSVSHHTNIDNDNLRYKQVMS